MSITAVSNNNSYNQVSRTGHGHHGARKAAFEAAAKTLGMSTDDLKAALKSGKTMDELAQSKGVSKDQLTSAISGAITGADSSVSTDRAQQMAQRMEAGPPAGGHKHHGGHHGGAGKALDAVASALNLTADQLRTKLHSGQSLTDVAKAAGMDSATLKSTITGALTSADSSLTADQASGEADKIIAGPPKQSYDPAPRLGFDLATADAS